MEKPQLTVQPTSSLRQLRAHPNRAVECAAYFGCGEVDDAGKIDITLNVAERTIIFR